MRSYKNFVLGQITISDTRSKRVKENIKHSAHARNKISVHANFQVCFSLGFHYNVLLGLIMISNTRSNRSNENTTRQCTRQGKNIYIYLPIFNCFGVPVIEILFLFNR